MAIRIRNNNSRPKRMLGDKKTPTDILEIAKDNDICVSPLDLDSLCHLFSIRINYCPLPSNLSGRLTYDGNQWVIKINALHHIRRQRFTIAHELAHYLLHRNKHDNYENISFHRGANYNHDELEADNFAGALLMPKEIFINYIRSQSNKIDDIAEYFGTSSIAVKKRADVIKSGQYDY